MLFKSARRLASVIVALPWVVTPLFAQELSDGSRFISSPVLHLDASSNTQAENRDAEFRALNAEVDLLERQLSLVKRVVRFASPSIVHIEAAKASQPGPGFAAAKIQEAGAGIVVSMAGVNYVLTNRHVIHQAQLESIKLNLSDGRMFHPERVWSDPSTDIAVLLLPKADGIVPARIGDSNEVDIGEFVLAVGSPFGLSHSVSYGIISAKGRRNLELGAREIEIQDFFQTDAAINPGNSGGPLLNLRGEVIGINTAIASNSGGNEGIGFSIPIKMAALVAEHLIQHGKLPRAYLGVQLDGIFNSDKAKQLGMVAPRGALIKAVKPESPAAKAGLQHGDVVLEFDGTTVENDGHLLQTAGLTPVNREVDVIILRDRQTYRVQVTLSEYPN
jgi:serine protease Do